MLGVLAWFTGVLSLLFLHHVWILWHNMHGLAPYLLKLSCMTLELPKIKVAAASQAFAAAMMAAATTRRIESF